MHRYIHTLDPAYTHTQVYTSMISTLSAAGRTKDVLLLLQHAHKSGVQPDEIMYSVCLQAPILQSPLDMSLCCKLTRALTCQNVCV